MIGRFGLHCVLPARAVEDVPETFMSLTQDMAVSRPELSASESLQYIRHGSRSYVSTLAAGSKGVHNDRVEGALGYSIWRS